MLLDLEEKDLPGVAYRVVEKMVTAELINPGDHTKVMRALLLRHRHVENHDRFKFSVRRNNSSYTSLQVCTFLSQVLFNEIQLAHLIFITVSVSDFLVDL